MKALLLLLFCFLLGCAPASIEDCRREAKGLIKSLIIDFKVVQTKEDLIDQESKIKSKVSKLTKLMIKIKTLQDKGMMDLGQEESDLSEDLLSEMKRIYQIEGTRELFESFQRDALLKLDAFDQSRKRN